MQFLRLKILPVAEALKSGAVLEQGGNKMGKILDAFLNDQLRIDSDMEKRSPGHQQLCEKATRLQEELAQTLNDRQKEMLEELVDTIFDEGSFGEQAKLQRGFRLGVLMTAEIFAEQDSFL